MSDPFAEFRAAVATSFAPVAKQLGLTERSEQAFPTELHQEFRGRNGRLSVNYELESNVWVEVKATAKSGLQRGFGLHTVVEEQTGSRETYNKATAVGGVGPQVRALADLTRRYAGSILTERTANLRKLDQLQRKVLREREQADGIPPVEGPAATLQQILVACPPDKRVACVYFANVEQNHSVDEIAAFLGVSKTAVEEMIQAHDTWQ